MADVPRHDWNHRSADQMSPPTFRTM